MRKYKITVTFEVERSSEHFGINYGVTNKKLKEYVQEEMEDLELLISNITDVDYKTKVKEL